LGEIIREGGSQVSFNYAIIEQLRICFLTKLELFYSLVVLKERIKTMRNKLFLIVIFSLIGNSFCDTTSISTELQKQITPLVVAEEPEKVPEIEEDSNRNKNRSGVRISTNYFLGNIRVQYYDTTNKWVDDVGKKDIEELEKDPNSSNVLYRDYLLRLQINFMIKAGVSGHFKTSQ